jgi:lipoprotein-releasing system ATP-binding protein
MSEYALEATNLHKQYKSGRDSIHVLRGIHFTVAPAEIVSLIGASGVGKSTLLHILGGLLSPDQGEVFCQGVSLYERTGRVSLPRLRNEFFGFVFQFHYLMPEFTAYENVLMPYLLRRGSHALSKKEAKERAFFLMDRVGLRERMTHRPNQLSGGEQQRVAVARALMNQPKVVLADEPTGNLDEATSLSLVGLLEELNRELGLSIVIATHNMAVARKAHRAVSIVQGGTVEKVGQIGIDAKGKGR